MLYINFIFAQTYFLIASSQIFKNGVIEINHGSFFYKKDSLQLDRLLFLKLNQLLSNTAICLYKFRFEKLFFYNFSHYRIHFQKLEAVKL